jgi:hypothetical protein
MSNTASFKPPVGGKGKEFSKPDEGQHKFRLRGIIDLGTITDQKFKTKKREVKLLFELVETSMPDEGEFKGKPYELSKTFTFSMNEKAHLRKFFDSWRGKKMLDEEAEKFDLVKWLKHHGTCIVEHMEKKGDKGKFFAVINNVMPNPKGTEVKALRNPEILFLIDDKSTHKSFEIFKHRKFDLERLQQCEEFKKIAYLWNDASADNGPATNDDRDPMENEDLPF